MYREAGGERGYDWRGARILLTAKGRTSGEPRATPLILCDDDGRWVVVASKGGAPDHPDWCKNLEADPEARSRCRRGGCRSPRRPRPARTRAPVVGHDGVLGVSIR